MKSGSKGNRARRICPGYRQIQIKKSRNEAKRHNANRPPKT